MQGLGFGAWGLGLGGQEIWLEGFRDSGSQGLSMTRWAQVVGLWA